MKSSSTDSSIRLGRPADAMAIAALCHRMFGETHDGAFHPDDMTPFLDTNFTPDAVRADMMRPNVRYHVAEIEGEFAGLVKLAPAPLLEYIDDPDTFELSRMYLVPNNIGLGLGRALVEAGVAALAADGYHSCWLHVWTENTRATEFYKRNGFYTKVDAPYPMGNSAPVGHIMVREF